MGDCNRLFTASPTIRLACSNKGSVRCEHKSLHDVRCPGTDTAIRPSKRWPPYERLLNAVTLCKEEQRAGLERAAKAARPRQKWHPLLYPTRGAKKLRAQKGPGWAYGYPCEGDN